MAEHTLYEDAPARVEIEFEYTGSENLKRVDRTITEVQEADSPVLYCECGVEFEAFEPAMSHLRETRE